jgi:phage antirepressor YoqD-like protein
LVQAEIAKQLEVGQKTISRWLNENKSH